MALQEVTITQGFYRGRELTGINCQLNGMLKQGARGWFGHFNIAGMGMIRVQIPSEKAIIYKNIQLTSGNAEHETEEQIIERIKERFDIFKFAVGGVATDSIRALIVAGAAGIGKTEMVTQEFDKHKRLNGLEYEVVRGNIVSSYQLYQLLYMNQAEDNVLVLDDCDAILKDANGLNILKAALESGTRPRIISYKSQSVQQLGLPTEFEYKGRMIFITNENFQKIIDKDVSVIGKHLKAIIDRTLYLDLLLHNRREIYCRIRQVTQENGLLDNCEIDTSYYDIILLWIKENLDNIRSLSLRTPIHIAEMIRTNEDNWQRMAGVFLLRQGK
jgi:hypothetical protein